MKAMLVRSRLMNRFKAQTMTILKILDLTGICWIKTLDDTGAMLMGITEAAPCFSSS